MGTSSSGDEQGELKRELAGRLDAVEKKLLLSESPEAQRETKAPEQEKEPEDPSRGPLSARRSASRTLAGASAESTLLRPAHLESAAESEAAAKIPASQHGKEVHEIAPPLPPPNEPPQTPEAKGRHRINFVPQKDVRLISRSPPTPKENSVMSSPDRRLQDTEKRAAAAAVVLMEKRLEGFVPVQDFAHLRAHVDAGFDSIGAQIRSATDAQIANYEVILERFLQKRRVKGWLKTHPAKYTRMLVCHDIKSLHRIFESWKNSVHGNGEQNVET
jgi:hypothetical protein